MGLEILKQNKALKELAVVSKIMLKILSNI